ncbi:MAG: excinuclease ABC subunit UvrC, partial [Alphaproteobacteria bacterium]|nr:excinuclease ABC subunit UvrC [Alphaproteobacteria bacterium]
LYVGKAKNLKKRVTSYVRAQGLSARILLMVSQVASLEVTETKSEAEALLLEANLIKQLSPRYNILLRDDKSFPYIFIDTGHDFPRISKHRGAQKSAGHYFGPFASAGAVNTTIDLLQRAFLLRPCADSYFAGRTRACLEYQIKRCSAPCVGHITKEDYAARLEEARVFLSGKSREIQAQLLAEMDKASAAEDYERAASFRDRARALTRIQQEQRIHAAGLMDADIVALERAGTICCVQVFFFRGGQNFGNRAHFLRVEDGAPEGGLLDSFLTQFYTRHPAPALILTSHDSPERALVAEALSIKEGRKVEISTPQRGPKQEVVAMALRNAHEALIRRQAESAGTQEALAAVATLFALPAPPARIEIYDNSHISGTHAVGAMVVAGAEGFEKKSYRKFNISKDTLPGDDYGMMREVMRRRFRSGNDASTPLPGLLLIDGGAGQLHAVEEVFSELGVTGIPLVAIAKGPDRNAGREQFFLPGKSPFTLPPGDMALLYLQRLRNEAHRFAISSHRARREKAIHESPLDGVPGIGAARKKALLRHFGSGKAVRDASIAELEAVEGISHALAEQIYGYFRG